MVPFSSQSKLILAVVLVLGIVLVFSFPRSGGGGGLTPSVSTSTSAVNSASGSDPMNPSSSADVSSSSPPSAVSQPTSTAPPLPQQQQQTVPRENWREIFHFTNLRLTEQLRRTVPKSVAGKSAEATSISSHNAKRRKGDQQLQQQREKSSPLLICPFRPGVARCIRDTAARAAVDGNSASPAAQSIHGCCCNWRPTGACASPISQSPGLLLALSLIPFMDALPHGTPDPIHLVRANESDKLLRLLKVSASRSCLGWDTGVWAPVGGGGLPQNFLALSAETVIGSVFPAAFDAQRRKRTGMSSSSLALSAMISQRLFVGPAALWSFGRVMKALTQDEDRGQRQQESEAEAQPATLLILSGDSMTRQLFMRTVHIFRSRMCSNAAERARPAVVEQYFHQDAAYVATTAGDKLVLGNASCFEMLKEHGFLSSPRRKSSSGGTRNNNNNNTDDVKKSGGGDKPPTVLFMMCFFWSPSWNGEDSLEMKLKEFHRDVVSSLSPHSVPLSAVVRVAAFVYVGSVWGCMSGDPVKGNLCTTPERYLFLARRAASLALDLFDARRVLISTSPSANAHGWNASYISERNDLLRDTFSRGKLFFVGDADDSNSNSPLSVEKQRRVRIWDLEQKRAQIGPLGCDGAHGMCVFWPPRPPTSSRGVEEMMSGQHPVYLPEMLRKLPRKGRNLVTGINLNCPSTTLCDDVVDYDQVMLMLKRIVEP